MTWLMIKQHDVTGLRYFCKTLNKNPDKYLGSGVYWKNHLKAHGASVSTIWKEWVAEDEVEEYAMFLSEELDVVNDDSWANLVAEDGLTGWGSGSQNPSTNPEIVERANVGRRVSNSIAAKRLLSEGRHNFQLHRACDMPHVRKMHSERMKGNRLGAFPKTVETKKKIADAVRGNTNVRGRIWIVNDITGERRRVDVTTNIPQGFRKGYKLNVS